MKNNPKLVTMNNKKWKSTIKIDVKNPLIYSGDYASSLA